MEPIHIRRIYGPPEPDGGARVLVDRVWPRGVRKADAALDRWAKDVAPSTGLRKWYGHDPAKFEAFAERYRAQLAQAPAAKVVEELTQLLEAGPVTLLTATKQLKLSHANVLADVLREAMRSGNH
ncbi:MAG: DUF488 domain-containing protein [Egibacteraceae bacterium]